MNAISSGPHSLPVTRAQLEALDSEDPLRAFRDRFVLPADTIYLDGNSLGAMPKAVPARLRDVVETEWGRDLIRSWNAHGWIDLQAKLGEKVGRLIGARGGETIVCDSTSINVFKAVSARPLRAPCVELKYSSTLSPSRKFALIGVSMI